MRGKSDSDLNDDVDEEGRIGTVELIAKRLPERQTKRNAGNHMLCISRAHHRAPFKQLLFRNGFTFNRLNLN